MDLAQRSALLDFLMTVVWPARTVQLVSAASQTVFAVRGVWDTAHDWPMAWINGNRVAATLTGPSQVTLAVPAVRGQQVIVIVSPGSGSGYVPRSGASAMLGPFDFGGFRGRKLAPSVEHDDAVRRDEVDQLVMKLLGGNYVLKTGDEMTGPLLLPAAAGLTDPKAAVRRDMVALLDGSQAFTGKQKGLATVAGDDALTLVTKGYVDGKVDAVVSVPRNKAVFSTPAPTDYTWTNTTGRAVTMYALVRGGGGGCAYYLAAGGTGAVVLAGFTVPVGGSVVIRCGGGGKNGGYTSSYYQRGGGGGGSGSRIIVKGANGDIIATIVAGGGGGGGGTNDGFGDVAGGAGGVAAGGVGGAAGIGGITDWGGLGGGSNTVGGNGSASQLSDTGIDFLFREGDVKPSSSGLMIDAVHSPPSGVNSPGQDGSVILRW
jgi:hypothetical protein